MTFPRRRGYTLVELLVVLVILGMVATVVVPVLRRPDAAAPRDAAESLAAVMSGASALAVRRAATTVLSVELASGSWTLAARSPAGAVDTTLSGIVQLGGARLLGGHDGWAVLTFDAVGRASGDRVTIERGAERWEVAADPWTAAAHVTAR